MATMLAVALEEARRGLLDLSTHNRLLSLPPPGRARGVLRLDDEDAAFVLARLAEGKAFGFEATGGGEPSSRAPGEVPAPVELAGPSAASSDAAGPGDGTAPLGRAVGPSHAAPAPTAPAPFSASASASASGPPPAPGGKAAGAGTGAGPGKQPAAETGPAAAARPPSARPAAVTGTRRTAPRRRAA